MQKIVANPNVGEIKGIKIYMYPEDHGIPHFHAFYAEYEAKYKMLPEFKKVAGKMPPPQEREIKKYLEDHKKDLLEIYQKIQNKTWDKKKILGSTRPSLISVIPQENFNLLLQYSNGEKRQFNIKNFLSNTINLKNRPDAQEVSTDPKQFETVRVEGPSVEWANGYDIDPEDLYGNSIAMELVASILQYPVIQKLLERN